MPKSMYAGSSSGTGNPPGKHSGSYLKEVKSKGHFVSGKGYRGKMHVGVNQGARDVGNQPKMQSSKALNSMHTQAIP